METVLANQDAALEERVQRLTVIVKPARADGVEVPGLFGLAGRKESDRIDFRAVHVLGMRVREHFVRVGVVINECHLAADRDRQRLWTDTGGGDGKGERATWRGRRGSPIV